MDKKSHPDGKSGFNKNKISILKEQLEDAIKILSDKLTKKDKPGHPLFISINERNHRYGILNNKYMKGPCISQFHKKAYSVKQLEKLLTEINGWADKCAVDIKAIYNENYYGQFNKLKLMNTIESIKTDKESLAGFQIKLKAQLENMIEFLLRRIGFYEEFGKYGKIITIELLIDQYTRDLFELLLTVGNYVRTEFYPDYFDPLSFFIIPKLKDTLQKNPDADVNFIIDKARSIICSLSREDYCFTSGWPLSVENSENTNSKVRIIKENFEREYSKLINQKIPMEFERLWNKKISGLRGFMQTRDLMEALNRLPVYMRDLEKPVSMSQNHVHEIPKVKSNTRFILNDNIDYTEFTIDGKTFHLRKNTIMATAIKFIHKRALKENNKPVPGHKILENSGSMSESVKAIYKNKKYSDNYHPALKLFKKTEDQKYIFNPDYL